MLKIHCKPVSQQNTLSNININYGCSSNAPNVWPKWGPSCHKNRKHKQTLISMPHQMRNRVLWFRICMLIDVSEVFVFSASFTWHTHKHGARLANTALFIHLRLISSRRRPSLLVSDVHVLNFTVLCGQTLYFVSSFGSGVVEDALIVTLYRQIILWPPACKFQPYLISKDVSGRTFITYSWRISPATVDFPNHLPEHLNVVYIRL